MSLFFILILYSNPYNSQNSKGYMDIPSYQELMLPLLKFAEDGKDHSVRDAINYVSDHFNLTEEQRKRKFSTGRVVIIENRVGWARTYLKKAGLLEDPKRGYFKITSRGIDVLRKNPSKIDNSYLSKFPEFIEFKELSRKDSEESKESIEDKTPEELIDEGYKKIEDGLAQDLLVRIRESSPEFFEQVVLDVMVKMGYGKGIATGGPGDGGIDGIINQDRLGLEKIYLQAKRYKEENVVTPNMVKHFIGTLDSMGANKGVFITTSSFHRDVWELVKGTHKSLVLIDGREFVKLMIEYDIGVSTDKHIEIKKIDSDYFEI